MLKRNCMGEIISMPSDAVCFENTLSFGKFKIYNHYSNQSTCDNIELCDNHIYFNAVIKNETINVLILYIQSIINNAHILHDSRIYIHINSKGGIVKDLLTFIEYKKTISNEIFSIVEQECVDCGILMAALCNYRIIKKNAICKLNKLATYSSGDTNEYMHYWCCFKQCDNNDVELGYFKTVLYDIICNLIDSKITYEKLDKYFQENQQWDSKKYKKLGLADEIV